MTKNNGKIKGVLAEQIATLMTPEAIKELGMLTPTVQQFLLRWEDARDLIISDELKEDLKIFLVELRKEDTIQLATEVASIVSQGLAKNLEPIKERMTAISLDVKTIKGDVSSINDRLKKTEDKVTAEENRLDEIDAWRKEDDEWKRRKKLRIDKMEIAIDMFQQENIQKMYDFNTQIHDEIQQIRPTLEWFKKTFKWWKIAVLFGGLTALWFAAHYFFLR